MILCRYAVFDVCARDRPVINSNTVDLAGLSQLPDGTLGREYCRFLEDQVCGMGQGRMEFVGMMCSDGRMGWCVDGNISVFLFFIKRHSLTVHELSIHEEVTF